MTTVTPLTTLTPHRPAGRADHEDVCAAILAVLLPYRRTLDTTDTLDTADTRGPADTCPLAQDTPTPDTPDAFPAQLRQLAGPVAAGEPIVFVLPGFPCKSPNPAKVLGALPDEGERQALRFLDALCARITAIHPPGARLVICSDGHVFSDLINVPDRDIDAYGDALRCAR
ncbi:L-tyrosine/L-tryptophan isonitrile synthase family protein [Streptomyces halobius]|uniref:L-tyrosine/L-tryptophan isonitrile synthase family protein n=1 Tax=Streptomyces halobius TaxID=2879846 RepID=UPI0029E818AF|nr:L-tyrosine/L-tryptophan isonitrile synthase family protein [Streptomyces halobius]